VREFLSKHRSPIGPTGGIAILVLLASVVAQPAGAGQWAVAVDSYDAGTTAVAGYLDPSTAVGPAERFTGELFGFDSVVSIFSPAFGPDEIVSLGEGGHLTLRFDDPVDDDPAHPFGIDLIVFGNTGFIDFDFPNGQIGSPAGLFGSGLATIEVSADGTTFVPVTELADGPFPTQGYRDSGPFDITPGLTKTNFFKPVDPALTPADFAGLTYAQALDLYHGSGGGTPIDIHDTGLASVSFVRVSLADDGNPAVSRSAEIDAIAAVPEPATVVPLIFASAMLRLRRGRRRHGRCLTREGLRGS